MENLKFGKYKVTRDKKLGEGASGSVYYGIHPNLDIPIAIKSLTPSFSNDESYVERFINEAKMAAKIKHENAVMIYDADYHDGTYYIVMEYVSGGDIKQKMKELGQMQEKEVLSIIRSIASALYAASKFNIIHRDIKPSNIMLGEGDVPKLADLGIAKLKSDESDNTVTGTIIGTPNYLAPEQAADSKSVDARADIYSLGCTGFAMLAGDAPYKADSPLGVLMKHAEAPIPDITSANPQVSKLTAKLIKKMMAKDPDNRPQSAEEVMKEIDRISLSLDIPEQKISKQKRNYLLAILFTIFIITSLAYAFLPKDEDNNTHISDNVPSAPTSPIIEKAQPEKAQPEKAQPEKAQPEKAQPEEVTPPPSIAKGFVIPSLEVEMLKVGKQFDRTANRSGIAIDSKISKEKDEIWK